ncbi:MULTISPECIES: DUF799 domain-containing protein [unclassified Acidovorax]|uniref:DUF799 domain-containing protein n=2 Tax=unclassified Acidovorax TaxID=2684926 RepID=UPI0028832AB6|nr:MULTISPECIES: DUF799 domain-containing protein [unclassified Acidovorax]
MRSTMKRLAWIAAALVMTGCATTQPYDYTALRQNKPRSILVMPPLNQTPEVQAPAGVLSQIALPLAEGGYYVLPVAVTEETFRQNGMTTAVDAQAVPIAKLREIFGADSALYLDVQQYGSVYTVVNSAAVVTLNAKLIDLRSGDTLWTGQASASSAEGQNSGQGLAGILITALINQIINTTMDRSLQVAGVASQRLLTPGMRNGLLHGPRSPKYGTD